MMMMTTTTTSSSTTTSTLISSYRIAAVWRYEWPNYGVRINISLKISHYIMITLFRLLSYNSHQ